MTTYIQKKERLFRERGDIPTERNRNVGEMKRIGSCIDRRAWATSDEERRQHILEYTKAKASFGTYVPVDVLIDLVCATKNAEIEALSKKVEELEKLLELYNGLDLTDEQRRKIQQMTAQIQGTVDNTAESSYAGDIDNSESTTYGVCIGQAQTDGCTDNTCTQTAAHLEDLGAINIDFNIDGSAQLEIDVEPVCDPNCTAVGSPNADASSSDLRNLLAQRDREIMLLKEEINQLKSNNTTDLEKKLTQSQLALASAQQEKAQLAKAITSSKAPELLQLEEEIACLRSNPNLTPEQETEIIKKELDVLKRYCDQLSNIQEENDQLKLENDYFKAQFGDCGDIQALKQRSAMLENVTCERDSLRHEVNRLAGGMEILRRKSDIADQLEREKCQLQKELQELNRARRQSTYDLELAKSENEDFQRSLEMTRCERDSLRDKLSATECAFRELQRQTIQLQTAQQEIEQTCLQYQEELSRLRIKAKESEVFRLERDRLQLRVEELSALEVEVLTLVEKVKNLSIERDVLKRQGCELHNIIADQEHEIKLLLLHVDRLSQCVEKQQDKIRTALDELQSELEHKNFLLEASQEQLHNESQQRLSLAQVENDQRKMIVDLKNELIEKDALIRSLEQKANVPKKCAAYDDDVDALVEENRTLRERIQQLECVCSHKHVDEILETSKQAVEVVIDEIKNKQNQPANTEYDNYMLEENKQLRKNSKDIQNMATERIDQLSSQLQQAIKENEELRAENEKLKSKGIETDLKICNSQLEERIPSSESDTHTQLMEELEQCRIANENLEMKLKYIQENENIQNEAACTCALLNKELERCRQRNAEIEMTLSNLNRVPNAEESKSIDDLKMKLELCCEANAQLESTVKCLRDKADNRVNASDDVVIKIEEQLEVEISVRKQLQQENCDLKSQNCNLKSQNCNLKCQLLEKDDMIKSLQEGKAPMETIYKSASDFTPDVPLSSEEQELQSLLNTLQEENKKLQTTIEVKDALITKMQVDLNSAVSQGVKDENRRLLEEIDQLKDIIQTMERMRQPVELTVCTSSDLKSKHKCVASINYVLAENENLKNHVAILQNEICDLKLQTIKKTTITKATSSTEQKAGTGSGGECTCDILKNENNTLKKKIAEMQEELDNLRKSEGTLDAKDGGMGCTCDILRNENNTLKKQIAEMQEELDILRKSGGPLDAKGGGVGCSCEILRNENNKLKKQIAEMQEELDNFRKSVTRYIPPQSAHSSPGPSMVTTVVRSRTSSKTADTMQLRSPASCSCSSSSATRSGTYTQSVGGYSAASPEGTASPLRADQPQIEAIESPTYRSPQSPPGVTPTGTESPIIGSTQMQIQSPVATSLVLSPARRSSTSRTLPPVTNEQLYIENVKLQAQMADLKNELLKFACYTCCETDSDLDKLHKINEDLAVQVGILKDEVSKLSSLRLGTSSPSRSLKQTGSEQTQLCSRVQLLQEEIQRLKEYQDGDSTEVEHLKKIIVQQENDVDKLRSDNIRLQRSLQECESMLNLPADEQAARTICSLKREIGELKCENECLRACLNSTSPAEERSAISKLGSYTSNKELRAEIEELRSQLACQINCAASNNNEEELERLRNENNNLRKTLQDSQNENSNVCKEMCKAKNDAQCRKTEIDNLNRRTSELERDKCQLRGKLENLEILMNKRLSDATQELQDRIRILEDEKLRMKREQQELLERLEQSVNRCSAQESELEIEIRRLKNKIIQLEKLNCSLESEFADCKDELEKVAKNRIRELEDKLRQAEDDRKHLEARLCKMAYEQDELTKKLEDKIREANEREIALESELMKLRGQVKALEDENIDLEKQLEEARYALEKLEDEIKEKICSLEQQLDKLSMENQKLQQEKEQMAAENISLKSKVGDLESNFNELGDLNASHMENLEQLNKLETQYTNCMEQNKQLLEEIEKLKQEKEDMKKEIADLLDKLQICDVNLADARDKEQLEDLVKRMELQLKNCDVKCKDTRQLDLELQRLLDENERLKLQCEEEKKALEEQFEKSLALLKEQYDRDLEFVRGRHSEGIIRLQDMHEDTVSDTVKEYEREIENLQRQLDDLMKQKQFDDETIKKQLEEIEKLRKLADAEVAACRRECKELRTGAQERIIQLEEENTKLKAELEIAKKCCEELNKLKQKLEEDRSKLKSSLDDVTRTSMGEIIKMRGSVDNILQKSDAEMAKMKDYLKSLEGDLEKARKDLENERSRLNNEISRLKAELDKAKKCCEELEKLTAQLESSGRRSLIAVEQNENEIGKLKGQLDLLNTELENEKKRLGAEIDRLKAELDQAKKCCDELEAIKRNLSKDNNDLESEIDAQRKKCLEELDTLKKLQEMNDKKYEEIIAQLKSELADHKKCCEELEKVKKELDNQIKMTKGAGDAEQQYKQDLMNLQKELENQKNQYELEIARLRRELDDKKRLEDEIARLKQELGVKEKCCDDLEKMKRELEANNSNLQKAYTNDSAKCEEELAKIKAELISIRKQYEEEISKLRKELDNCKSLVNDLQKQKDDLENTNKSLKSQLDKANADNANQLAKLKSESDEARKHLEDELARLKKELGAKQKCCDDLEGLQKQLEAKNKELANALNIGNKDCEEELAKLKKELDNLKKKYDDELSKLKADLDSERKRAEEAMSKLRSELEDQKRRNDELEGLKKNLEKQLGEARSKGDEGLENCLEELAKLKKDLERNQKRYEDEIDSLKKELAEKSKCCDQLENIKKELDNANKSLQAAKDEASKRSAEELNNLKKDLDDTIKRYEDKLSKLKDEMAAERKQYEDEINKLKSELANYKKCCDELDEVKLALQNEKMRLESEINKLKQDLQNEKDNRKRDVDDLKNELEKAKQCCKDLEATKKELENLMSRHEKDLEKMKKDFEDQQKHCADDLAECRKKLDELKQNYESQIDQLKKDLQQKEKCCEELDGLKNNLLDDNNTIKKQYEDELNRLQSEIDKGKKCCEDLEDAKKQLAQAKKDCEDEMKKLKDEMNKIKDEMNNLTARLQEAENEKANLAAKLNGIENEYNKLKQDMLDEQAGNKALQDCRDELLAEKKRCESEIAKLRAELEKLQAQLDEMQLKYGNEVRELKELVKKGEKCCEELERQKKGLQTEVDEFKDRRRNSRDSATQERSPTRDSQTQDRRSTRDSTTLTGPEEENISIEPKPKVCPCGALAKERGYKLSDPRNRRLSQPMWPEPDLQRRVCSRRDPDMPRKSETDPATKYEPDRAKKLDKLSKATALIVEVREGSNTRPHKYSLTKKSIIITNVEPSSPEVNKQLISLEEERPINLTRSIESILSKALKVGLENLTHEELSGLHSKTKDAVQIYEPLQSEDQRGSMQRRSTQRDSVQRDSVQRDSVQRDSFQRDSVPRDSFQRDSMQRDSMPRDSMPRDSVLRDSMQRDSVPRDSVLRDSMQRDSVPRDSVLSDSMQRDSFPRESVHGEIVQKEPRRSSTISGISESELALTKLPLQRRISELENELSLRQNCACQKMRELENTILAERQQMIELKNKSISEQRKLNWENDSLKQQASFHEIRLQQLLAQIEQEKARSTSLKADLMKAKAIEAQLLEMLQQSRAQGQCSYEAGKLHPESCLKAKGKQRPLITETDTQDQGRKIEEKPNISVSRRSLVAAETDQDTSEIKRDDRKRRSSSRKRSKKK